MNEWAKPWSTSTSTGIDGSADVAATAPADASYKNGAARAGFAVDGWQESGHIPEAGLDGGDDEVAVHGRGGLGVDGGDVDGDDGDDAGWGDLQEDSGWGDFEAGPTGDVHEHVEDRGSGGLEGLEFGTGRSAFGHSATLQEHGTWTAGTVDVEAGDIGNVYEGYDGMQEPPSRPLDTDLGFSVLGGNDDAWATTTPMTGLAEEKHHISGSPDEPFWGPVGEAGLSRSGQIQTVFEREKSPGTRTHVHHESYLDEFGIKDIGNTTTGHIYADARDPRSSRSYEGTTHDHFDDRYSTWSPTQGHKSNGDGFEEPTRISAHETEQTWQDRAAGEKTATIDEQVLVDGRDDDFGEFGDFEDAVGLEEPHTQRMDTRSAPAAPADPVTFASEVRSQHVGSAADALNQPSHEIEVQRATEIVDEFVRKFLVFEEQSEGVGRKSPHDHVGGVPSFRLDLNEVDSLFPSLPRKDVDLGEPSAEVLSSISARKLWHRISRPGTLRAHDSGDIHDYVRVAWRGSETQKTVLTIVSRWLTEDRNNGGAAIFGANSSTFGPSFGWTDSSEGNKHASERIQPIMRPPRQSSKPSSTIESAPLRKGSRGSLTVLADELKSRNSSSSSFFPGVEEEAKQAGASHVLMNVPLPKLNITRDVMEDKAGHLTLSAQSHSSPILPPPASPRVQELQPSLIPSSNSTTPATLIITPVQAISVSSTDSPIQPSPPPPSKPQNTLPHNSLFTGSDSVSARSSFESKLSPHISASREHNHDPTAETTSDPWGDLGVFETKATPPAPPPPPTKAKDADAQLVQRTTVSSSGAAPHKQKQIRTQTQTQTQIPARKAELTPAENKVVEEILANLPDLSFML